MAQRDKKEEPTELRAPEITLCANNCGFPGNPATQNLCQSCFSAATASMSSPTSSSSSAPAPAAAPQPRPAPADAAPVELASPADAAPAPEAAKASARTSANRCSSCRKRVGLTGFRCRCGELFCGAHRYSDRHGCSYDYKGAARDAIARENPVVRAAKIVRF
ncbi:hypothetical protein PAHAL_2G311900 [Panicum hallii]|jgi:hypothetical protein|uniref:AN1-type domain-containing protein n=1 Tax=Panicum hallii TaxID=206008 RepID=A0A2S3H0S7_9POAL|nr:zinc finger A20 and AN1 domain-containing stress-associated protein 1 [Panicum hallii]PAN13066.1 hypothetical protein PAHAL_2G311900 [Panicum hallii]